MRGLYRVDLKGKVVPDLVERATRSDDGKQWTFKLKKGIRWSDGIPLVAAHAAASLNRLKDPRTGSSYSYFLSEILEISTSGERVLTLRLRRPVPYLPAILSHWVTYPIRPDLLARWSDAWKNPEHLAFLGSYRIVEVRPQTRIVLAPNPMSGGPTQARRPWLRRIEAWIVSDDLAALNLYDTGRLEFIPEAPSDARNRPGFEYRPTPVSYFIGVAESHPLTRTRDGVLALSAALDRREIPLALDAPHRPALELIPPEFSPAPQAGIISLEGDAALARRLLAKAGFQDPRSIPPLTLRFFNRPLVRDIAQWIQAQWKKNLGLQIELQGSDVKTYWSELRARPAALFLNSKGASYPDADAYLRLFASGSGDNLGRWHDEDYDRWIESPGFRARALRRLQDEKPALIPLFFRASGTLLQPYVRGLAINPLTSIDLSAVRY
jgi:oligopeptide transport system substrate-binding protein